MALLSDPVRFSNLRNFSRSPAHYRCAVVSPREPTPSMRLGTTVHKLLLGGPLCVYPGERRGKAWDAFRDAHRGEEIITETEHLHAARIADAVDSHPIAPRLLAGVHERRIDWSNLGRACSSTPDVVGEDFLTDLKTASTTQPEKFKFGCLRLAYHAQLAFYLDAVRVATGRVIEKAYLVGVETEPPFCVTVLRLTPRTLLEGRKLNRMWMEQLLNCEASGAWPGYVQSEVSWDIDGDVGLIIDGEEVEAA
jgi:exodeoxyribonuclease VIII